LVAKKRFAAATLGEGVGICSLSHTLSRVVAAAAAQIRSCWRKYFLQANAVIFVVDSADSARYEEAKRELQKMLGNEDLRSVPLLVYANKQDNKLASDAARMADVLDLSRTEITRPKFVQGANAHTNEGLREGLDWLTNELKRAAAAAAAPKK
jgi:GTPase SAR1 family protein